MKKIKSLACIALAGISLASCDDFLTLMPLNEVVLENFWTDKSDVESVLLGAYAAMETEDCVTRMSMWGEMRSDNIIAGKSTPNDLLQITKDNILETNPYTKWACFYDAINRANTVLHYAPIVADTDPNYSQSELRANLAEATAIRSLCYWYLIRAYKDVPFVTEPSIDDTQTFIVPQSSFDDILDQLIEDLESVKNNAVKFPQEKANTARFTKAGILAILTDMYLWKGDWDKCIQSAEDVLTIKNNDYLELVEKEGLNSVIVTKKYGNIPLISESGSDESGKTFGTTYNEIFGDGFSFESLFELSFERDEVKNAFVNNNYGDENTDIGTLAAYTELGNNVSQGTNKIFSQYDGRFYESVYSTTSSSDYGLQKYRALSISYELPESGEYKGTVSSRSNQEPNWIIYRLTDVLLMEAEAKVMKASTAGDEEKNQLFQEAFEIVKNINNRSTRRDGTTGELKFSSFSTSVTTMEELVLLERRRELLFEGKRWFDLVRMARRDGNTKRLTTLVLAKYTENVSAIRIKLADMDAMYFPINKDERKINTLLKQNPAYVEDEFIQKN